MDLSGADKDKNLQQLQEKLSSACVDFSDLERENICENVAMCEEELLEKYLEDGLF